MDDFDFVRVYLKYLLIIKYWSFEDYLYKVKEVLNRLQLAGLKCNIDKCNFLVPKVKYLG